MTSTITTAYAPTKFVGCPRCGAWVKLEPRTRAKCRSCGLSRRTPSAFATLPATATRA